MEDAFDHLVLDHPLSWKVKEPVVAEWTDCDSDRPSQLGTLNTKTNPRTGPNLVLAVGCRDNSLLIILHIAVKLRPSTGSRPKHMFLVLPTESLLHPPFYQVLESNKVPENTLAALGNLGGESGATCNLKRIIKLNLQLNKSGYVIMPQTTIERQVQGSPRHLLEHLRSLSNSLSFNVYMRFNTFAEVGLCHAEQMIQNGQAITPTIHVDRMFNRVGAVDVWGQYLLPPPYKANPLLDDKCNSRSQVLVPRSTQASPSHESSLGDAGDGPSAIKETPPPPPPPLYSPTSPQSEKRKVTSQPGSPPPPKRPTTLPRSKKRRATSPPPADSDLERFCSLLCLWLEWAWTIIPDAHEVVRDDLIALGRAICAGDRTTMARLRAQCTKCIIFTATDRCLSAEKSGQQPQRATATTMLELENEFQDLVQWINHADCFADMALEPKLRVMAQAVRGGDISTLVRVKAECIVAAITLRTPSSPSPAYLR